MQIVKQCQVMQIVCEIISLQKKIARSRDSQEEKEKWSGPGDNHDGCCAP